MKVMKHHLAILGNTSVINLEKTKQAFNRSGPEKATRRQRASRPHQWTRLDGADEPVCEACLQTRTGTDHAIQCREAQSATALSSILLQAQANDHRIVLKNDEMDHQVLYCTSCAATARAQARNLLKPCTGGLRRQWQ